MSEIWYQKYSNKTLLLGNGVKLQIIWDPSSLWWQFRYDGVPVSQADAHEAIVKYDIESVI